MRARCAARATSARPSARVAASIGAMRSAFSAVASPGTALVAGAAPATLSAAVKPMMTARTFTPALTDEETASRLVGTVSLPLFEEPLDMPALSFVERHVLDDPACLSGVVVCDGRLQPLALRVRLAQLPPQPAQERDRGRGRRHSRLIQVP